MPRKRVATAWTCPVGRLTPDGIVLTVAVGDTDVQAILDTGAQATLVLTYPQAEAAGLVQDLHPAQASWPGGGRLFYAVAPIAICGRDFGPVFLLVYTRPWWGADALLGLGFITSEHVSVTITPEGQAIITEMR